MFKIKGTSVRDVFHGHYLYHPDTKAMFKLNYISDGEYEVYNEDWDGTLTKHLGNNITYKDILDGLEPGLHKDGKGWFIIKEKSQAE